MKILTLLMLLKILFFLPTRAYAACELYNIDFISGEMSTAQYTVDCGEVSSSQWSVNNAMCQLTTAPIQLGGSTGNLVTTPLTVEIVSSASTTICNDYVLVQYQIDNGSWITQDSISACEMSSSVYTYNFNVVCGDTSAIKVRVIMFVIDDGGGSASEKLRIRDGGICASSPAPMPIELVDFTAQQENDKVKFSWVTASEVNNDYFLIEKSTDGKKFEAIAFAKGNGTVNTPKYYSAYDENPFFGISYYRLKQVDYSGAYKYHKTVSARYTFIEKATLGITPNPCNGTISMNMSGCEEKEILVVLYDMMGKKVYSKVTVQDNGKYFFTGLDANSRLQPGIYLVVGSSRQELFNQKLIINDTLGSECSLLLSCNY